MNINKKRLLEKIKEIENLINQKHQQIEKLENEIVEIEISLCNDVRFLDQLQDEMINDRC